MVVYCRHGNTHIVRASSKVLSYIMLFGIFLGYLTAALILLERTDTLCQIVLFSFSIGFCIVVGTLLIKTNRIHRIFSKRAMRKGTLYILTNSTSFLGPFPWLGGGAGKLEGPGPFPALPPSQGKGPGNVVVTNYQWTDKQVISHTKSRNWKQWRQIQNYLQRLMFFIYFFKFPCYLLLKILYIC